ncbi:MAG: hypothetical protein OXD31_00570 [Chloroflexi bacterium]|nr:hypothetical protein [Chloroflexota bacterium]
MGATEERSVPRDADESASDAQLETAMVAWVRRRADENGSQLARDLEVGQATISRWNNSGSTTLTERLREQVTAYWEEHGIVLGVNAPVNDVNAATAGDMDTEGVTDATSEDAEDEDMSGEGGDAPRLGGSAARESEPADSSRAKEGDVPEEQKLISHIPLSVLPRVERATTSEEIARETGVPVLALLDVAAARSAAQEMAAGWQWKGNAPPSGVHGDALLYMHTREEVFFHDEGAKAVAFAVNAYRFACGLTAAEMRFGIDPRLRQAPYAAREHWDRPLLIGTRLAALIPAVRYEDEDWFFGSRGLSRHGEVQPSAAELVARRRVLQDMVSAFELPQAGLGSRLWLVASVELLEVEVTLLGPDYELTFGEQVFGNRMWPPSTRLGIETDWRVEEIRRLEALLSPGVAGTLLGSIADAARASGRLMLFLPVSLARTLARRTLRRRGLWDTIYNSPYRRAVAVVRSGDRPSRRSIWGYRLLRRLACVSVLGSQCCGLRDWQAEPPPWSEAYHRRFRAERIPVDYTPDWMPYEFDREYNFLPRGEVKAPKRRRRWSARGLRRRAGALSSGGAGIRLPIPRVFGSKLTRTRLRDASSENRD